MPNHTTINWTDLTTNLVRARRLDNGKSGHFCTHKNEKCRNCYAEAMNVWRGNGLKFLPSNRSKIEFYFAEHEALNLRRLNARLKQRNEVQKVFVSSMTDLFQETMPVELIEKVFGLISECENLIFQTLTKRIDIAADFFKLTTNYHNLENLWFGLTPEDDGRDIPDLFSIPAPVVWLSLEPLLKPLDLSYYFYVCPECCEPPQMSPYWRFNGECWEHFHGSSLGHIKSVPRAQFSQKFWIVVGGESGPKARPTMIDDLSLVIQQSRAAGIPVWVKQLGKYPMMREADWLEHYPSRLLNYRGRKKALEGFVPLQITGKGEEMREFPTWLRVRELPQI